MWIVCGPAPTTPPPAVTTTTVAAPTPTPAPAPAPAPLPLPPVIAEVPGAATVMIGLINADRAAAGLAPLKLRDDISAFSSGHAKAMAEAGDIWHNDAFFTSATKQRFAARRVGENVARHSGLQAAHVLLMNSPGHRANLLSPTFRAVGIAAWANGGTVFVAQNFIEPISADGSGPTAAAPASKPAAAAGPTAAPAKPAASPVPAVPTPAPAVLAAGPPPEPDGPQGAIETAAGGLVPGPAGALPTADTDNRGDGWPPVLPGAALAGTFLVAVLAALARRLRLAA